MHLLDYDVDKTTLEKSLDNMQKDFPNHWFTRKLKAFFSLQMKSSGIEIDAKEFSNWILNAKILHLFMEGISPRDITYMILPVTTVDNNTFIQACIQELALKSPGTTLEQTLKNVSNE